MGAPLAKKSAFVTDVTAAVTNDSRGRIRDIQAGWFRIILDRAGLGQPGGTPGKAESSVGKGAAAATYLFGRGERSQTDTDDLNVPLVLECVLTGRERWLEDAS